MRYLLSLLLLTFFQSYAATLEVVDQHQKPVHNAVIEYHPAGKTSTPLSQEPAIMDQIKKRFVPELLVIRQGRWVNFPNSDNIRHHVYSFSKAKPFELKLYSGRPKAPVEFEHSGVVILGCNIHDSMVGYIYVAQSEFWVKTNEKGQALINPTPNSQITIWHAHQNKGAEFQHIVTLNSLENPQENFYRFKIEVTAPKPRDSFRDQYSDGIQRR